MNVMAERKRTGQKPKRYSRPVPGDRVQMDTCQILAGLYQLTATDDCRRFLVAHLAPRRSAAGTMATLTNSIASGSRCGIMPLIKHYER